MCLSAQDNFLACVCNSVQSVKMRVELRIYTESFGLQVYFCLFGNLPFAVIIFTTCLKGQI
jgi:hypothetical protein